MSKVKGSAGGKKAEKLFQDVVDGSVVSMWDVEGASWTVSKNKRDGACVVIRGDGAVFSVKARTHIEALDAAMKMPEPTLAPMPKAEPMPAVEPEPAPAAEPEPAPDPLPTKNKASKKRSSKKSASK